MQLTLNKAIEIANSSNAPVAIINLNEDELKITYCHPLVSKIYDFSEATMDIITSSNIFSLISSYDAEYIKRTLKHCEEFDENTKINLRVPDNNGSVLFFDSMLHFLGKENEASVFLCFFTQNIDLEEKDNEINNLQAKERRLLDVVSFGGIFTWDYNILQGTILNISDEFKNYNVKQINNYPFDLINWGIIDAKDAASYLNTIESLKNGANEVTLENWYHFPDNKQPRFLKIKYILEYNDNNKPYIAHGMGIDLTEQKNAEVTFEHRTNAVLRTNPDSLAAIHINLTENLINPVSSANSLIISILNGKTVDDLIANAASLIQNKNERLKFINAFSRGSILSSFSSGNFQIKAENHMLLKNNHDEWVRTIVDIVKNPLTGDVEAVMHIINIHYAKVIDSMINGTVQREFDFIAIAYIKTNSYVLIDRYNQSGKVESPNFIETARAYFNEIIQSNSELNRVLIEINYDNLISKIDYYGEYILRFNTSDDPDKNHHKLIRFSFLNSHKDIISVSCRDITRIYNEEKEQNQKLSNALDEAKKANEAKSQFLSLVSHDIRTPLNGIMSMTQLALMENNNEKTNNYLKKAEMSSGFLLGLINDLLDMSKIESGKLELHPQVYPLSEFMEYIDSVIKPLCDKKSIQFSVIKQSNIVPYIIIDKLRLNQIIFNLLSNSCKYTNEFGKIDFCISSETVNDSIALLTFIISDNGIGMTPEFQNHLFDTFSQENRMSFDHNEGTGLGLSITHSLIELMGGDITFSSEINKGTTFKISLTVNYLNDSGLSSTPDSNEDSNKESARNDYTGYNFLVCEDNIINQEIANEIFTSLGANVIIANDGLIGLNAFKESETNYYSAIFMDIRMPNMDGLKASAAIRMLNRPDANTVPIIAMTANAMSDDKSECIESGMNAFIAKPINIKDLYKVMNDLIK